MMKKIGLYLLCCSVLVVTGCNKFLDKEPDNRAQLNNPQKVSQLVSSAYPKANYQQFAEVMSDNVEDVFTGGNPRVLNDAYRYIDGKENQQDSPEYYWYNCYEAIAAANQALKHIEEVGNTSEYSAQRGEALVARAYAHFMLVTFFAKFYDPATAATDPGIPYVLEPENVVVKQYSRNTVQYVYDQIEKDLLEGFPLINDGAFQVPKYHFNRAAAAAFASRFYLYKRDYNKVLQYAGEAVSGGNYAPRMRGWNDLTSPYNTVTDVNELFRVYTRTSEAANLLLVETGSLWFRNHYGARFAIGPVKRNEVFPRVDPLTGGVFAFKAYFAGQKQLIAKIDEYFLRESVNANFGLPFVMVPLFTVEEVLFNHAEALYYTGNIPGAIALLNTYAARRITNYNPTTHNVTEAKISSTFPVVASDSTTRRLPSVIQAILAYKRAEFVHEGQRWFDVLRYNIQVVHNVRIAPEVFEYITLLQNDPRRTLQLPEVTIQAGLAPNPR